jgi:hypothetical protein
VAGSAPASGTNATATATRPDEIGLILENMLCSTFLTLLA